MVYGLFLEVGQAYTVAIQDLLKKNVELKDDEIRYFSSGLM